MSMVGAGWYVGVGVCMPGLYRHRSAPKSCSHLGAPAVQAAWTMGVVDRMYTDAPNVWGAALAGSMQMPQTLGVQGWQGCFRVCLRPGSHWHVSWLLTRGVYVWKVMAHLPVGGHPQWSRVHMLLMAAGCGEVFMS